MRKFMVVAIPTVTIILFILIMHSSKTLKKPFGNDDDVLGTLDNMIDDVNGELWEEADDNLIKLNKAWEKVMFRVQFSSGNDEIYKLDTSIARLQGAVEGEDKASALMELYEIYKHWDELGK